MRTIKFRAWHIYASCLKEVIKISFEWKTVMVYNPENHKKDDYLLDETFLQQYTNINDRNGKEIYEDDIVRIVSDSLTDGYLDEKQIIGIVKYVDARFVVETKKGERYDLWENAKNDYEVIGNIYENRGLL